MDSKSFGLKYKEIFIKKSSDKWIDIVINTGGVASTLQDVKSTRHSGGYAYLNHNNRFIYWRTNHDVLELVEDSLDVNLTGNQLRYKFTGSYVLEGISIHENHNAVDILVPTVSSVHRFTFPHPDKLGEKVKQVFKLNTLQGLRQPSGLSIFHGALEIDAMESKTYRSINVAPTSILTVASCLSKQNEAVFALALNSSILLVSMDPLSGTATTVSLTRESILPRFFSGLTESFLSSRDSNEGKCVSMVLHTIKKELYLFCLERDGNLKVWSCDRATCVQSTSIIDTANVQHLKGHPGQNHKLCKGISSEAELILCAHLEESVVIAVKPVLENGIFTFKTCFEIFSPAGMEIVDMVIGGSNKIWCAWMTGQEQPIITVAQLPVADWSYVELSKPPLDVKSSPHFVLDPAQIYLDSILTSGFFTASDIAKALSTYRTSAVIDPTVDIREQIRAIVESEVLNEVPDLSFYDEEYMEVVQRCWSRLFSCCTQYLVSGINPLGLFWLPSCSSIVLIKETGFSLARELSDLEIAALSTTPTSNSTSEETVYDRLVDRSAYDCLVECLKDIDMEAAMEHLELSLHLGEEIINHLDEAAALVSPSEALNELLINMFSKDGIREVLQSLADELHSPDDFEMPHHDGNEFCSESGIKAVISTFRDFCHLRLRVCEKVLLLLQKSSSEALVLSFTQMFSHLCKSYYVLLWTCVSNVAIDMPLIEAFASSHSFLMQSTIIDSVMSLACNLWHRKYNEQLPLHLLATKQYSLLIALCRIIGPYSWCTLGAQAYLATGEPYKALDRLLYQKHDVPCVLNVIEMFQKYRHPDLVISAAETIISSTSLSRQQREILNSIMFIRELELGHYDSAYSWVVSQSESSGRSDCLHRLIVEMLSANKVKQLLSFPFTGMRDQLEKILESRARTSPIETAYTYYNLLHSVHIKHDAFKKAAAVMFEKGLRSESTEMQWKSYVACLSALMLVSESEAWIVKPTGATDPDEDSVEVLELADVRREFELARARHALGNCPVDTTPQEVIALCVSNGHFKTAMKLCRLCNLSMIGPMEGYTVFVSSLTMGEKSTPWKWLRNNEIHEILVTEDNYKEVSWKILEQFVKQYEKPGLTELHKAVSNKLMEIRMFLPNWLLSSYKKRNCSELIRLYMQHGQLTLAASLSIEYLRAGMGIGKENFGIETGLFSTGPPMWLPLHIFELLILEVKEREIGIDLEKTLKQYIQTAVRVSYDLVQAHAPRLTI